MNHVQILKRSWTITWKYRALWVLGFLLALTSGGGGNGGGSGSNSNFQFGDNNRFNFGDWSQFPEGLADLMRSIEAGLRNFFRPDNMGTVIGLIVGVSILAIALGVLFTIIRYVSEAGIIRMVNRYESTEEKVSWRQGWRMGWSRAAFRLFLIDLVVYLPVVLGVIALFGCAALPVIVGSVAAEDLSVPGLVATIGMVLLAVFAIFALTVVLGLFMELVHREAVLNDGGVFASIRTGWNLMRSHLKDIFILWLIMVGIQIGVGIAGIPVFLLAVIIAVLLGGGAGVGLYFLLDAVATGAAAWGWGIGVGVGLFILLLVLIFSFLTGLFLVYRSSVWTLAYRDVTSPVRAAVVPTVAPGGDELPTA